MTRNLNFVPNEIYHIYNRGTEKRNIFVTVKDCRRFLCLLYLCNSTIPVDLKLQGSTLYDLVKIDRGETLVNVISFCLMPNHFHILISEKTDGGISKFMQKLTTAYTMYFNKSKDRTGALFQGKFKAKHASISDNYLKYLVAYIHLNPIKLLEPEWREEGIKNMRKAEQYLNQYAYSSYLDFIGEDRIEKIILNKESLPLYFGEKFENFKDNVEEYLQYKDKNLQGSTL